MEVKLSIATHYTKTGVCVLCVRARMYIRVGVEMSLSGFRESSAEAEGTSKASITPPAGFFMVA